MTLDWFEIVPPPGILARRRFLQASSPDAALRRFLDVHVNFQKLPISALLVPPAIAAQLGLNGRMSSTVLGLALLASASCSPVPVPADCTFLSSNGTPTAITGSGAACGGNNA